jgi:hypothetical protein
MKTVGMVGLALAMLVAAGCSSARVAATEKMAAAERAIGDATQSEAALAAAPELRNAEGKLAEARAASTRGAWEQAGRLADEAQADADHARAQATSQRARKSADDMRQNVQLLRRELEQAGR